MSPEVLVSLITAASVIGAAVIAAFPALRALQRHTAGAVEEQGTATREHLAALGQVLNTRIDDVRTDIEGVREDVSRVREWQAAHDAEHLLIGRQQPRGDTT
ncbi:hypothetical protein [Streptomyces canus]|uniref:hypothetical protein n=1 Tax=Streptomyces canus TaxID=58343 RepID=UPI00386452D5|nr:hypothetical protein OH824_34775 [Streptomyces canus]